MVRFNEEHEQSAHSREQPAEISPEVFARIAKGLDEEMGSNLDLLRQASLKDDINEKATKMAIEVYLQELLDKLTGKFMLYAKVENNRQATRLSGKLPELARLTREFLDKRDKAALKTLVEKFSDALANPVNN